MSLGTSTGGNGNTGQGSGSYDRDTGNTINSDTKYKPDINPFKKFNSLENNFYFDVITKPTYSQCEKSIELG